MVELNKYKLEKSSLIRHVYRALLQRDRTYAAFETDRIVPLVEKLATNRIILDPMSGYGGLMIACQQSTANISAFCIEYNPPAYFWQILINPKNSKIFIKICNSILTSENKWPEIKERAALSATSFPDVAIDLLLKLYHFCLSTMGKIKIAKKNQPIFALAFLLPFVGRFSSYVQGNIVTNLKPGGMVVFQDWKNDFILYIRYLVEKLEKINSLKFKCNHTSLLANCLSVKVRNTKFRAMITSPPYPNSRSYSAMFGPENEFLNQLEDLGHIKNISLKERLIGNPRVSVKKNMRKMGIGDVQSSVAQKFLENLRNFEGSKSQKYDNDIYYIPLFAKYFVDLELAYQNILSVIDHQFEGYIVVVNNTCRKKIVPVAEFIVETWKRFGFNAEVQDKYSRELSHVGGINPRVKGLSARHVEYTIKISR